LFEDIFVKLHDKNREIKVMGIWGKDGLVLEKKYFSEASEVDLELTGAELADVISRFERMKLSMGKYFINLQLNGYFLIISSLTPDYFIMMVADPAIIPGKLKFYLDLYRNKLISAL
jgi:predicted regulator of Ras-like GTPase activity (Roadblock/LC7/MglB family)